MTVLKREMIRNFEVNSDWRKVPMDGGGVVYFVNKAGVIVSIPNKVYIENAVNYGKRVKYDTATIIRDAPRKKESHGRRVTLCVGMIDGNSVNASFPRENIVYAGWRNTPELLMDADYGKKYRRIVFKDGDNKNCALDNLSERKDYCCCSEACTEAYVREYGFICNEIRRKGMEYKKEPIQREMIRDIVSESFLLSIAKLGREKNVDSHRVGIYWLSVAKSLFRDVVLKGSSVDTYTKRLNIRYRASSIKN